MVPKANQPSLVLVELAPKVNNEQELCILGAEGKPIVLNVGGAEGKPAKLGAGCGRGGVGTDGEPKLHTSGEGGGEQIAPSSC